MCITAWENAYSERINRTIKEEYLDGWQIKDFTTLRRLVTKAIKHHNHKRRHQSLNWITSIPFEEHVKKLPPSKRPIMKLYKHVKGCEQLKCE